MFFLIGGIAPRVKKLDEQAGICPRCGTAALYRARVDHYLSLFFIPLFPVSKGQPGLRCENCGLEMPEQNIRTGTTEEQNSEAGPVCPGCHRPVASEFRFCPYCGRSLN